MQKSAIAIIGQVVMHIFRIYQTTVAQDITHLPAHHRMFIEIFNTIQLSRRHGSQSPLGAGVIAQNVIFEDMDNLIRSDICVADTRFAVFVYNHQRLERAGAEAAHLDDLGFYFSSLYIISQVLQ